MKKFLYIASCLTVFAFAINTADAGVHFLVQSPKGGKTNTQLPKAHTCLKSGYNLRTCPAGSFPNKRCPDDASFYDKCCDGNVYKYSSSSICARIGMIPQGECGGKYSCVEP